MSIPPPTVLIVGGGHAGIETAFGLRAAGFPGRVHILSQDRELPYERPPLSKAWLKGKAELQDLYFRNADVYAAQNIELSTGTRVTAIDRERRHVVCADGSRAAYDHLVLATGARPRQLPVPGADLDGVHCLHTYPDAARIATALDRARSVVIVGGGFIGLEVAAAAAERGRDVVVLEAADRVMQRAVTAVTSTFYQRLHGAAGTRIRCGTVAREIVGRQGRVHAVRTGDGEEIPADLVVVGIGAVPADELAAAAGLRVADGIVVDAFLRTTDPAVFAVGDCARFPREEQGHLRLESVQNAVGHGRALARTLTATPEPYREIPWFWTDQLGCKLQMAGLTSDHDEHTVIGDPEAKKFTVLCWKRGELVGGESVNRPGDHIALRTLLAVPTALPPGAVPGRDFDLKAYARTAATAARTRV
ncbi:NAD(P)/FAD-dependent oxidoreductase [Streptomyces hirsutus]|uniref:NAD(P)/FAD-dependent oxidoreductase n=1 Tax=Streptomyces hirsutus TaxID=35620 RepID=UPI003665D7F3